MPINEKEETATLSSDHENVFISQMLLSKASYRAGIDPALDLQSDSFPLSYTPPLNDDEAYRPETMAA